MSQNSKGNVSIANIIALVGLAGVGVVTFFGILLHSEGGAPSGAVIGAVGLVALLSFLLFMTIKAKGAEDNVEKWKLVEWAFLALYVVAAIAFAKPFQRFFYVVGEKSTMQAQARKEIKAIKALYVNYEHQQKKYVNDAVEQIHNYIASGQQKTSPNDALAAYVSANCANVESWATKATAVMRQAKDTQLSEIEGRVESWNLMQLSTLAADLELKDSLAWTNLEAKIKKAEVDNKLIPVITGGGVAPYKLNGYAQFDLGEKPKAAFAEMLRNSDGNTVLGWVVFVLLHALILFNYLVAARGRVAGIRANGTTGGLEL